MSTRERRKYRRTKLRLRVSQIEGLTIPDGTGDLWTSDVSPGGMFIRASLVEAPQIGTSLKFELSIPPGEGYSLSPGHVRGSGKVARIDEATESAVGVAVGFTSPLALAF